MIKSKIAESLTAVHAHRYLLKEFDAIFASSYNTNFKNQM